jgi:hypothetical protein
MKPERHRRTDEKTIATPGTARLPCLEDKPSTRRENCDSCDIERVYIDTTRKNKKLDDPPDAEQGTKHYDGATKSTDSCKRWQFTSRYHKKINSLTDNARFSRFTCLISKQVPAERKTMLRNSNDGDHAFVRLESIPLASVPMLLPIVL